MKNKLITLAAALVIAAALGKFYALPAIAQTVRAALTQSTDEVGRIPYQASSSCSGDSTCYADFPAVPANKRLVITHVSGYVQQRETAGAVGEIFLLGIAPLGSKPVPESLLTFQNGAQDTAIFNESVLTFMDAGYAPRILVGSDGGPSLLELYAVQLSGYLLDCSTNCAAIAP